MVELDQTHAYLGELQTFCDELDEDVSRLTKIAAIAEAVGARTGSVLTAAHDPLLRCPAPPPGVEAEEVLGLAVQLVTAVSRRHSEGMYFTPSPVAAALLDEAFDPANPPESVADLCCGGGAFLLAAAKWFERTGMSRAKAVERLRGVDLDPVAVAASRSVLAHWAKVDPESVAIVPGDGFDAGRLFDDGPFGAVVGNPPFQSQLGQSTARTPDETAALKERFGSLVRPYVDTAALFLVDALDHVSAGGTIALVLPQSVLATRDVAPIRETVADRATMRSIWFGDSAGFDASVRVCGLILENSPSIGPAPKVRGLAGAVPAFEREFDPPDDASNWSEFNADRQRVPRVKLDPGWATVASLATATAGFRDEYYALAAAAVEGTADDVRPRLVTSGLIEVLDNRWGVDEARFAKQRWVHPVVSADRFGAEHDRPKRWMVDRLVPKLLVATQTKVIEVVVDAAAILVPVTPVLSIEVADPEMIWHLAAALSSPVASVVAFRRTAGSALTAGAIKLSAKQVLSLPLPQVGADWDRGAELAKSLALPSHGERSLAHDRAARKAKLIELGPTMCSAYGVSDPSVVRWWSDRL